MGRRQNFLDEAVQLLRSEGFRAEAFAGDVRDPQHCTDAVDKATKSFGSLDILVNCAAGNFLAAAEQMSSNAFKTVLEIDTMGTWNVTRAAFEPLKASKFGGVVTSITATLHYTATWYQTAPVAAKAAIDAFSRNLALEWGEYGIRCNTIAPGPIEDTPGFEKLSGGKKDVHLPHVPMKRAGTKREVASACIFLCLNKYITGERLAVDGGEWFGKVPFLPRESIARISRGVEKQSRDMGPASKL